MDSVQSFENRDIEYVLCDVDDTLTTKGKLLPQALTSLWNLHDAGFKIIPITGGSAGWADAYLRQWPIDAVISESGAVAFYKSEGRYKRYTNPTIDQMGYRTKADCLIYDVLKHVKKAKLSSDHFARIFDIAFDYKSELPYLNECEIEKILEIAKTHGASSAVSSIHVNLWFGNYDKFEGTRSFFRDVLLLDLEKISSKCVYVGDAPNDQIMFKHFRNSFGVANIKNKLDIMKYKPSYIANEDGGLGFNEIADKLISLKAIN